jgi:hypothetical protein
MIMNSSLLEERKIMLKKMFFIILLAVGGLLLLAGCKPICDTDSLMAPVLDSPANWSYVGSTMPELQWTYPDDSCTPEGYRIDLLGGPAYSTDLSGGTGDPDTTWYPGEPLQSSSQYKWRVTPINGTTLGPSSEWHRFFTPPACGSDPLNAPIVDTPEDGETVATPNVMIGLVMPGCLPDGTGVEVSLDPTFSDQTPFFDGIPALNWLSADLEDCSTYFVRAYSTRGDTEIEYSDVNTFFTDFTGTCPPPETSSAIGGIVWLDECDVPMGTVPATIPDNCVLDHTGTIVYGDGIRQPGENGIPDVTVNLGEGYCPSTGLATAVTDEDGLYLFPDLTPGRYCISINAEDNDALQKPGMWTRYLSGHEGWTYHMIVLLPDVLAYDNDFGWYPFLEAATKSFISQCPPGQTWNALSGGCQGQCPAEMTWNFQTGQCEIHSCSAYKSQSECEAHSFCVWRQGCWNK